MTEPATSLSHFGIHATDLARMEEDFHIEAPTEAILAQTERMGV
jgi:hypothetical protein